MAAPDGFKITIKGKGGHGSEPNATIDPIYISAQVINAIQGVSSRMIKQTEPFVISVCSIHSGTKDNIIPDNAYLEGTIRTLNEKTRVRAKKLLKQVVESTCRTFGAKCDLNFVQDAYPVTYNDPKITQRVMNLLKTLKNGTRAVEAEAILGGEDVSRFLQLAPGTFYWLGTVNKAKDCIYPNHSSRFKVDENVLKYGTASLALIALEFTKEN
jgi:carboxypeptidase Ss1